MNAHDLPRVGALVHYLHACAGFPVRSTCHAAINSGNYSSWPGLTFSNPAKYCLVSVESLKVHLTQTRQGYRSKKPKQPYEEPLPDITTQFPEIKSRELHMFIYPISKLYTDDMGRFPVRSRSRNHYIMLAYHFESNTIFVEPFQSRHDSHCLAVYDRIMSRIKRNGHTVDLQIMDNKASESHKLTIG